ncbi:MAG: TRAP transporter substrate-binding protein [Gammaproteobacteria bacterium]
MRFTSVVAALVLEAVTTSGSANAVELIMSTWASPNHSYNVDILFPWIKQVEEASNGRIQIKMLPSPAASPVRHYDAVMDGLIDVTFISHEYYPGRFELQRVGHLPFIASSGLSRSVAIWRIFEKYLADANEHAGLKVLGIWATAPGSIFSNIPIRTVDDMQSLKLRAGGGMALAVGEALGATPVVKPANDSYELLSGGVADGTFFSADAIVDFQLDEVIAYALTVPGGFYASSTVLVMNTDAFESLSEEDKEVLLENSGEAFARLGGRSSDARVAEGWEVVRSADIVITEGDSELVAAIRDRTLPIVSEWKARASDAGLDPDKILQELEETARRIEAETATDE